jgi:hypothetical protein
MPANTNILNDPATEGLVIATLIDHFDLDFSEVVALLTPDCRAWLDGILDSMLDGSNHTVFEVASILYADYRAVNDLMWEDDEIDDADDDRSEDAMFNKGQ